MKTLRHLASLLLIMAFGCSCTQAARNQQNEFQVIKVNLSENTSANLSDFVENTKMIKLETNDSCLISFVTHIEITPNHLFVSDNKHLYQFDKNGNYIRNIGSVGHGPNEFTSITCFTCSAKNKRIYIGSLRKVLCFDFEGNFIKDIKFNDLPDNLTIYNNQLWVFYTEYNRFEDGTFENRNIVNRYALNKGVVIDSVLIKSITLDRQTATIAPNMQYLSEAANQLYIYSPILIREPIIRDTLYRFYENRLVPALRVDFSNFAKIDERGKDITINNINRNDKYLFAEYLYQRKPRLFVYDFQSENQYNLTEGFTDDIFGTGNVILRPLDINFRQMYFLKNGYELNGIIEGVNEDSNPVVFIVKLKE